MVELPAIEKLVEEHFQNLRRIDGRLHRDAAESAFRPGADLGAEAVANTPAQMDAFQKSEAVRWAKVIRESGVKTE